jgi:hypothetical protein
MSPEPEYLEVVTLRLSVLFGAAAIGGAIAVLLVGGGWWAFWPALLGLALLTAPIRQRYWERVEQDDPASGPLQAMWWAAGWTLLAVFLGVAQLAGVWFHQSTGRGLLAFVAACFFAVGWSKARSSRRRLLRTEIGEGLPG